MENLFIEIHVFFSRDEGYSKPIKISNREALEHGITKYVESCEDEIINWAVKNEYLADEDANQVDYIGLLDESEYNDMRL